MTGTVRPRYPGVALALLIVLLVSSPPADGHPLTFTATELSIRADGTFQVEMVCDLDALALGAPQDSDDAELVAALRALSATELADRIARLRELFRRRVRIRFDGRPTPFDVSFPDHGTPRADEAEIPTILGLTARLSGSIPAGAGEVEFFASRAFSAVHLTIVDEGRELSHRTVLERGARSDPFDLTAPAAPRSPGRIAWEYLGLGLRHIVPEGIDHILFVLGLFLLSTHLRPLVWQVTAFTLAHALTLTLASLALVRLDPAVVEPLIALSIAYVGIENLATQRLTAWRPVVVFAFGLLHGLGFASVLQAIGLPDGDRALGLLSFNVGIELGQLLVIGAAFALVGGFRHRAWYRARVVVPASAAIAVTGVTWTIERVIG